MAPPSRASIFSASVVALPALVVRPVPVMTFPAAADHVSSTSAPSAPFPVHVPTSQPTLASGPSAAAAGADDGAGAAGSATIAGGVGCGGGAVVGPSARSP